MRGKLSVEAQHKRVCEYDLLQLDISLSELT